MSGASWLARSGSSARCRWPARPFWLSVSRGGGTGFSSAAAIVPRLNGCGRAAGRYAPVLLPLFPDAGNVVDAMPSAATSGHGGGDFGREPLRSVCVRDGNHRGPASATILNVALASSAVAVPWHASPERHAVQLRPPTWRASAFTVGLAHSGAVGAARHEGPGPALRCQARRKLTPGCRWLLPVLLTSIDRCGRCRSGVVRAYERRSSPSRAGH